MFTSVWMAHQFVFAKISSFIWDWTNFPSIPWQSLNQLLLKKNRKMYISQLLQLSTAEICFCVVVEVFHINFNWTKIRSVTHWYYSVISSFLSLFRYNILIVSFSLLDTTKKMKRPYRWKQTNKMIRDNEISREYMHLHCLPSKENRKKNSYLFLFL